MNNNIKMVTLPDDKVTKIKSLSEGLNFRLKLYHADGKEELIPGVFWRPDDVHYGFDYFVDLEKYVLLEAIVQQLKPTTEDQLRILFAVLNYEMPDDCREYVVKAEIIDKRTSEAVVSIKNREINLPNF